MENKVFQNVGEAKTGRSKFDLSYEKKFNFDMGELIPVMCDEVLPGDIVNLSNSAVVRFQPMIKPLLHKVKMKTYYFFVPYRILDETWEEMISRGKDGNTVVAIPRWPINSSDGNTFRISKEKTRYSLWDYLGFPTPESDGDFADIYNANPALDLRPMDYPRRAYYDIWNEYFRDQNLQEEYNVDDPFDAANLAWYATSGNYGKTWDADKFHAGMILNKNWNKDYFTSALPFQQRGTAPQVPIGTTGNPFTFINAITDGYLHTTDPGGDIDGLSVVKEPLGNEFGISANTGVFNNTDLSTAFNNVFNSAWNGTNALGMGIDDLRLTMQIQAWMERNARAGVRYTEFLKSHFPAFPRDERLQRPEYIGGTSNYVIFSEVLQTSKTDVSPQGNLAGHGIGVQSGYVGKYRVEEFGLIMGIAVVYPDASYQQGLPRQFMRRTTFDFYFPEFANLSEQEIFNYEIYIKGMDGDTTNYDPFGVFGFTGRYNELRYKKDMVCGDLRDTQDYWHLGRQFAEGDDEDIALNSSFVLCTPRKDIFAVPAEKGLICSFANKIDILRPMPYIAEPYNFS